MISYTSLKSKEKDITPEIPDSSLSQGILPKLIAKLVERRRMVKNLMKNPKATPSELAEVCRSLINIVFYIYSIYTD